MITLPSLTDLDARQEPVSVGDLAKEIYPNLVYDTSLPIGFTEALRRRGFDIPNQFVWGYPEGHVLGRPYPLTTEAIFALSTLSTDID